MKKVHITPKNKSFIAQRSSAEVSLVRAVSLGAVMVGLLSSVSPVFASHLSSVGSTVQSESAGVVSANVGKAGSGRIGVANGGRSCGVDQVIGRSLSRLGKKVSAEGQYKKLTKNQLSDVSGSYSFESSCGADASANALKSASARSLIDVDVAKGDWLLEENNTINWSVNTRSVNTTGVRVAGGKNTDAVNVAQLKALPGIETEGQTTSDLIYFDKGIHIGARTGGEIIRVFTNQGDTRFILGVTAGSVKKESTDAINGSQLYDTNTTLAKYLGGGAAYDGSDGDKWTEPKFTIQGTPYNDVGNAFAGVDGKLTDLYNQIDGAGLVVLEPIGHIISIGPKVEGNEISIINKNRESRKLTGVAEGHLSEDSAEAVNGAQLWEAKQDVYKLDNTVKSVGKNVSSYLGGGANILENKAPTYTIQGTPYNDVGNAFAGVDEKLTDLYKQVGGVAGNNLVEQDPLSHIITIGKEVDGGKISILNNEGKVRTLVGLADGQVTQDSKEAVNGGQLYEMNTTIAQYFGGGADVLNGIAPTFTVINFGAKGENGKQTYNNVADAFGAINTSMSGLSDRIEKIEQQTGSQVNSDGLSWNNDKGAYSASHNDQGVNKITDIKDGTIAQGSTDAVTGHQLWSTNKEIDSLKDKVDNIVINGGGALTDGAVIYDKDKDNTITLAGTDDNTPVLIDNVADGEIEEGSKQAVNGGQLKKQMSLVLADANKYTDERIEDAVVGAVAQANAYTDMKFEALNYRVEGVQKEARQAAAIGLAVANLHYIETPGMLSIAFGSGVWRGQSALAFGTGYMSEDGKMRSNFSVTTSGGHWGVGAGLSLALK
uniref:Surface protein/adhesin n=1 Tax=Bartonella schoenbuchensis TaxID=165694 RepID=A0A024LR97_9HYPH|nr:surface protein/adhesin [Bartonella schoenbuchensis]